MSFKQKNKGPRKDNIRGPLLYVALTSLIFWLSCAIREFLIYNQNPRGQALGESVYMAVGVRMILS